MLNKTLKILAGIAAVLTLSTGAYASFGNNSAMFTAKIKLIKPLVVKRIRSLDFGEIIAGTSFTIRTFDSTSAAVKVTGESDRQITASLAQQSLTLGNGSNVITIDNFTMFYSGGALGDGITVKVGATVTVPADMPSGDYSGTMTMIVAYQ